MNRKPTTVLYTVKEVAELLDYTPDTIYLKARTGEIPAIRVGRNIRFRASDVEAWIDRQPAAG